MSRTSKHERIIRETLDTARRELAKAEAVSRTHQAAAELIEERIITLEVILERAEADKTGGDDAES